MSSGSLNLSCFQFRLVSFGSESFKMTSLYKKLSVFAMTSTIQDRISSLLISVMYTQGFFSLAHPEPQLTTPANKYVPFSLQTSGPPLTPWQLPFRPSSYPAQIIRSVIDWFCRLYFLIQSSRAIIGASATRMRSLIETGPDCRIFPQPVTEQLEPAGKFPGQLGMHIGLIVSL